MKKIEIPLTNEHLRAIGNITVMFIVLEDTISFHIWALIGNDQQLGRTITAELSFKQKVALLSSLFRHRASSSEELKELKQLLSQVMQAEEKRNAVIHSGWIGGNAQGIITRVKDTAKISLGLKFHSQEMRVKDLDKIADFIAEVAYDIHLFFVGRQEG